MFDRGIELPAFAAYPLAGAPDGRALLIEYYEYYAEIARSVHAATDTESILRWTSTRPLTTTPSRSDAWMRLA